MSIHKILSRFARVQHPIKSPALRAHTHNRGEYCYSLLALSPGPRIYWPRFSGQLYARERMGAFFSSDRMRAESEFAPGFTTR